MLAAITSFLKSVALALGWIKQVQDQATGAKLAGAESLKEVLDEAQAVANARDDPGNLERVRAASERRDK